MIRDLTGQRFGRLVARNRTGKKKGASLEWECECDCGKITYVASSSLVNGNTRSCGCLRKETTAKTGQMHTVDLTGQRFGRLTAVRPTDERKNGSVVWECVCDCGNTVFTQANMLSNNQILSCGCLKIEASKYAGKQRAADLTGQKFNHLTAVRPTDERRGGSVVWECTCDCGNTVFVNGSALRRGLTKSCGCLKKEMIRRTGKQRAADLTGQTFGRLTAIRPTDERKNGAIVWECTCDCGNTVFTQANMLLSNRILSCGCLKKEIIGRIGKRWAVDITGQTFNRLTAVHPTDERRSESVMWECKCECGNTTLASVHDLRSGNKQSCGCLRKKKRVSPTAAEETVV